MTLTVPICCGTSLTTEIMCFDNLLILQVKFRLNEDCTCIAFNINGLFLAILVGRLQYLGIE